MNWQPCAQQLAERITHPTSRWQPIIAAVPRHVFVPRWWKWTSPGSGYGTDTFTLADGPTDQTTWLKTAYRDRSLVTQVGPLHADHANPVDRPSGMPTSSATLPGLIIQMLRHVMIDDGMEVLDGGRRSHRPHRMGPAGFMHTRTGLDYPPNLHPLLDEIRDADGDHISSGRYPVTNVVEAWELWSTLGILHPGIEHHYEQHDNNRTAFMLHSDGSWARATSRGDNPPIVYQGGPRRLWDLLDDIRATWLRDGSLPVYGAQATIAPDGTTQLRRGRWQATIA